MSAFGKICAGRLAREAGLLQLFAVDGAGQLHACAQRGADAGAGWSNWAPFPSPPGRITSLALCPLSDGQMQLLASTEPGEIWRLVKPSFEAAGAEWRRLAAGGRASFVAAGRLETEAGQIQIFAADPAGRLQTCWQGAERPWSVTGWVAHPTPASGICALAISSLADQRLMLLGRDRSGQVWQSEQLPARSGGQGGLQSGLQPGALWSDWEKCPGAGRALGLVSGRLPSEGGRHQQFLLDPQGQIHSRLPLPLAPGSGWSDWLSHPGPPYGASSLALAALPDGRAHLFATDRQGQVWGRMQQSPARGAGWTPWFSLLHGDPIANTQVFVKDAFISHSPAQHTYVTVMGETYDCFGDARGGTPLAETQGVNLCSKADILNADARLSFALPLGGKLLDLPVRHGILYAINGVCHSLANRLLYQSGKTVHLANGARQSFALWGVYGTKVPESFIEPLLALFGETISDRMRHGLDVSEFHAALQAGLRKIWLDKLVAAGLSARRRVALFGARAEVLQSLTLPGQDDPASLWDEYHRLEMTAVWRDFMGGRPDPGKIAALLAAQEELRQIAAYRLHSATPPETLHPTLAEAVTEASRALLAQYRAILSEAEYDRLVGGRGEPPAQLADPAQLKALRNALAKARFVPATVSAETR